MGIFKRRKATSQAVCLLTQTNKVEDFLIEAGTLHAESFDTAEAWGLDGNSQAYDPEENCYIQFVSSVHCKAVKIYEDIDPPDVKVATIASMTEDAEMIYTEHGKRSDGRLLWVGIALAGLILVFGLVALIILNRGEAVAAGTYPALAGLGFLLPTRWFKRKKKVAVRPEAVIEKAGTITDETPRNAMVVDRKTRTRVFRYIPDEAIPLNAYPRKYGAREWLYILGHTLDGRLWPIEEPEAEEGSLPSDLFMAKHCAEDVEEVYGLASGNWQKVKIGVFVGLCVGIIIVTFLLVAAAIG